MKKIFINIISLPIYFYKFCISPVLPSACNFIPSCSTYFLLSVREFGAMKGSIIGIKRILRCTPNCAGGFDPIPINIKGDVKWIL